MIADTTEHWKSYFPENPVWRASFEFLAELNREAEEKRHEIRGDDVYAMVSTYETVSGEETVVEAHRDYVDIQALVAGAERIECFPVSLLKEKVPYDAAKDAAFYHRPCHAPITIDLTPGIFSIFFPQDAHSPKLALENNPVWVKKVVVKIRLAALLEG